MRFAIRLTTASSVQKFVKGISELPCDVDLSTGSCRYLVNAKSILGVFSLDLSQQLVCELHTDDTAIIKQAEHILAEVTA